MQETYGDLFDEFLDEVFGYESSYPKEEWVEAVIEKQAWILSPNEIREKLYRSDL